MLKYKKRESWPESFETAINYCCSYFSEMRAASQLSGRGPTDMDVAPVPAC